MEAGDQQLFHTPFVPSGYWSPCAPLVWNPVKAPDIRFSFSHFRKQHPDHEKAGFCEDYSNFNKCDHESIEDRSSWKIWKHWMERNGHPVLPHF
ncbi:unnamed protein product [Schistosoma margrebowiei]|uniref:Uncharacterized protein n=1 Tax=Schistosoma margrebowiei TaxID=48269 RepID=A0A183LXT7_9TREM|nr:unnamed protein product [Schistosoma margrebowiei]